MCASRLLRPVLVHPVFLFFNANPFPPSFCVHGAEQRGHGNAVLSASLDGTVRAFDLTRYRNFRTLTAPTPTQFISLAVDQSGVGVRAWVSLCGNCRCLAKGAACFSVLEPVHALALFCAGEIVCAGAMDPFNIFIWSMQVCVCALSASCVLHTWMLRFWGLLFEATFLDACTLCHVDLRSQTGKILDVLSGHEGPVCGLALASNQVGITLLADSPYCC